MKKSNKKKKKEEEEEEEDVRPISSRGRRKMMWRGADVEKRWMDGWMDGSGENASNT
ncbi:unnamed protein product, partial [Mesocestoides corti]|uniref:Uncharacterized protein n=1 Tax=Mesocestoides corti TaxID=53468 RepID=A0A0R3URV7_MESCO